MVRLFFWGRKTNLKQSARGESSVCPQLKVVKKALKMTAGGEK